MSTAFKVHWLGAGLSSRPGFTELARDPRFQVTLWNRSVSKAEDWVRSIGLTGVEAREFEFKFLESQLGRGDIVVSMLPADQHPEIARICIDKGAHLVTTSYLSPEMRALNSDAKRVGVVLINEIGLDPGIDHLFAHTLVSRFKAEVDPESVAAIEFHSLCGGFPKVIEDAFRYRFSWSPLGVLRALKNPARWIENGELREVPFAFKQVRPWSSGQDHFEMYPNRNSEPYADEYGLAEFGPRLKTFIRGTLRPGGWAQAWQPVFQIVENGTADDLAQLSEHLAQKYSYQTGEKDRVCMEVRLRAFRRDGSVCFNEAWVIDQSGDAKISSAMAELVSYPAALAVRSISRGELSPGVQGVPREDAVVTKWLTELQAKGCYLEN